MPVDAHVFFRGASVCEDREPSAGHPHREQLRLLVVLSLLAKSSDDATPPENSAIGWRPAGCHQEILSFSLIIPPKLIHSMVLTKIMAGRI